MVSEVTVCETVSYNIVYYGSAEPNLLWISGITGKQKKIPKYGLN
jgi:hypothetical protein